MPSCYLHLLVQVHSHLWLSLVNILSNCNVSSWDNFAFSILGVCGSCQRTVFFSLYKILPEEERKRPLTLKYFLDVCRQGIVFIAGLSGNRHDCCPHLILKRNKGKLCSTEHSRAYIKCKKLTSHVQNIYLPQEVVIKEEFLLVRGCVEWTGRSLVEKSYNRRPVLSAELAKK